MKDYYVPSTTSNKYYVKVILLKRIWVDDKEILFIEESTRSLTGLNSNKIRRLVPATDTIIVEHPFFTDVVRVWCGWILFILYIIFILVLISL